MTTKTFDKFGARARLGGTDYYFYRLDKLSRFADIGRLPFSIRVLLEALLRTTDGFEVSAEDVERLARWSPRMDESFEVPFKPGRVILQDFTGVPAVVDLAAMRAAMARLGGNPDRINPIVPVDLVIDHSVQVDQFGSAFALFYNAEREFERNRERYEFLKWGQEAFQNFRVVPPATGIVHQVNLEYLGQVVMTKPEGNDRVAFPDSLVGTDSHTTMINGLGILGWGVGGIEAEAVMLGQPIYMLAPEVVGVRLTGGLPDGATATDLVLRITEMLRKKGVVGKFVEYFGPGLSNMTLADRATIANMCPEYGATVGYFPVDAETLNYMRNTGRPAELIDLVNRENMRYREAEMAVFGIGHEHVGARLAERWKFPEPLVAAIRDHHPPRGIHAIETMSDVVAAANLACDREGLACGFDYTANEARKSVQALPPAVDAAINRVHGGIATLEEKARAFLLHVTSRAPRWYALHHGELDEHTGAA